MSAVPLNIDTATIQRLRDALLDAGRAGPGAADSNAGVDHRQQTIDRFSPFAELMFLVAMADGHEDPAELDALRGAMHLLTANQLSDETLTDIYQRCRHDVSELGAQRCLERIGSLLTRDRQDRETAFSLAAAVALADNKLLGEETALMGDVAEYLGVSNSAAKRLLQTI